MRSLKLKCWKGHENLIMAHIRLDLFVSTKGNVQANLGPILHQDSISFHLSHQPPLKVMCHFLCSKSDKFTTQKVTRNFQK